MIFLTARSKFFCPSKDLSLLQEIETKIEYFLRKHELSVRQARSEFIEVHSSSLFIHSPPLTLALVDGVSRKHFTLLKVLG